MSKLRRRGAGGWLASRSAKQTVAKDGDETLEAKQGSRQQKGNLRKKTENAARIERLKATNKKKHRDRRRSGERQRKQRAIMED